MARLTITAAAGASSVGMAALEELMAAFAAALATLVSDGAAPTQAHVTAVNDAYTPIAAIFTADLVVDIDRATLTTRNLIQTAVDAAFAQATAISTDP